MKSFFRVEHAENKHGPWRDFDGNWDPVFDKLTVGKCRDLPMPDNEIYRKGGLRWVATTDKKETLLFWFDIQDIMELEACGYIIAEYVFEDDSVYYTKLNQFESIIVLEKAVARNVISLDKFKEGITC